MPAPKFLITLRRKLPRPPSWNERNLAKKKMRNFGPSSRKCPTDNNRSRPSGIGATKPVVSGNLTPANEVHVHVMVGMPFAVDANKSQMIHTPDQHHANATTICHKFSSVVQEPIQICRCQQPLDSIQQLSTRRVNHSQEYQCDMYYRNPQMIDRYQQANIDHCSQFIHYHQQPVCATDKTTGTASLITSEQNYLGTKVSSLSPVPNTFSTCMPLPGPLCLLDEDGSGVDDTCNVQGFDANIIIQARKDAIEAAVKLFGAKHPNTIFAIQSMQEQCDPNRRLSSSTYTSESLERRDNFHYIAT